MSVYIGTWENCTESFLLVLGLMHFKPSLSHSLFLGLSASIPEGIEKFSQSFFFFSFVPFNFPLGSITFQAREQGPATPWQTVLECRAKIVSLRNGNPPRGGVRALSTEHWALDSISDPGFWTMLGCMFAAVYPIARFLGWFYLPQVNGQARR